MFMVVSLVPLTTYHVRNRQFTQSDRPNQFWEKRLFSDFYRIQNKPCMQTEYPVRKMRSPPSQIGKRQATTIR